MPRNRTCLPERSALQANLRPSAHGITCPKGRFGPHRHRFSTTVQKRSPDYAADEFGVCPSMEGTAEGERIELPRPCGSSVFKTAAVANRRLDLPYPAIYASNYSIFPTGLPVAHGGRSGQKLGRSDSLSGRGGG